MIVLNHFDTATNWVRDQQRAGKTVGIVPTMGALHAGHMALVETSKRQCDLTVVTLFVNPTQFGPQEDLNKYPRTLQADKDLCQQHEVDLLFTPSNNDMYPSGFSTYIEPPAVSKLLEGECRPGHFRGVATVVLKLFQILPCDRAYFGQKDYQQVLVIKHMVRDLNLPIEIVTSPTIRETDGLALSSRNRYLSPEERIQALALSQALFAAQGACDHGERNVSKLEAQMHAVLGKYQIDHIEYAVIRDQETLEPLQQLTKPSVALIAARVGQTRLIDNHILKHA